MRAARLLAILSRLQARGHATAGELAALHEVSVRTIYRDVDALSAAGFPVYGDAGPGGGFRLLDVPTERLTSLITAEAEAMLLVSLPGPAAELGLGNIVETVRDKLLLRLAPAAQVQAGKLAQRFHLDPDDWYRSAEASPDLPRLARAILDERRIRFAYTSWRGERDWTVDPLGIVLKGGSWYLVSDGGKGPMRMRVDAMRALVVTDEKFDWPCEFDLARWWQRSIAEFETELRPHFAELLLTPAGGAKLAEHGRYAADAVAAARDSESGHVVTLPYETIEQAAGLVLSLGDHCQVTAPDALVERVRLIALAIAKRHDPCVSLETGAASR